MQHMVGLKRKHGEGDKPEGPAAEPVAKRARGHAEGPAAATAEEAAEVPDAEPAKVPQKQIPRGKANPKRQPESPEAGKAKAKPKGEPNHSRVVSWDDNVQKMNKELAEVAVPHI